MSSPASPAKPSPDDALTTATAGPAHGGLALPAAVVAGLLLAAGGALAAENVHDPYADPSEVNATAKVKHTVGFTVDNVSNDGNADSFYLTFPDDIASANLSSWSGNVTDADTRESISISSSPSIVDGPDGDGIQETVKIGTQSEGERTTRDLIVNFTGYATWPDVSGTQDLPVKASVVDSGAADVTPPETFTHVTVVGGPGVATAEPTEVDTGSATLNGEVTELAGAQSADAWFAYWIQGETSATLIETSKKTLSSAGTYEEALENLQADTTYVVEARMETADGETDTGDTVTFATPAPLSVSTGEATDVEATSATLHGEVEGFGEADTVDARFAYWVQGQRDETLTETSPRTLDAPGTYQVAVDGLQEATTYVYEARATGAGASATGATATVETPAGSAEAVPRLGDGFAEPGTVDAGAEVPHTFGYRVDNLSNEGQSIRLYLAFPDDVADDRLSSFSGDVHDAETGAAVSVSSSPSIVDGPDGDGIQETVTIGVQPSGERATRDLQVNFTGTVTWPTPDRTRELPVEAAVVDDAGDDVTPPLEVAAATVEASLLAETRDPTAVEAGGATLHGAVPSFGAGDTVTARLAYWVQGEEAATRNETAARTLQEPGPYQVEVTGLEAGTTYVVQARAEDDADGEATGETLTFTTAPPPLEEAPGDGEGADVDQPPIAPEETPIVWNFWAASPDADCRFDGCHIMTREGTPAGAPVRLQPGDHVVWATEAAADDTYPFAGGNWTLRLHCTEQTRGDLQVSLGVADGPGGDGFTPLDTTRLGTERCEGEDSDVNVRLQPGTDRQIPEGDHLAVRVEAKAHTVVDVHAKGEAPDTQLVSPQSAFVEGSRTTPGPGLAAVVAAVAALAVARRRR
jgi:hypothetical protein